MIDYTNVRQSDGRTRLVARDLAGRPMQTRDLYTNGETERCKKIIGDNEIANFVFVTCERGVYRVPRHTLHTIIYNRHFVKDEVQFSARSVRARFEMQIAPS